MSTIIGGATVYAKDLRRVAAFYEEVCGLRSTLREHDFFVLESGQLQIVVVKIPEHIARTFEISSPPVRREDSALKLTFVVKSVAAARTTACKLGGMIDPTEKEWEFQGMRVCDGHDPEGNVIQVREHSL